jgi:hypothetical protein
MPIEIMIGASLIFSGVAYEGKKDVSIFMRSQNVSC